MVTHNITKETLGAAGHRITAKNTQISQYRKANSENTAIS